MNLSSFGISNFKAFGESLQRMPVKPITLIFGPNSAGKSSLLHGLLWTAEILEQNSFDIRSSKRVSGTLDLGGFLSVLRAHNPANKIRVSVGQGSLPSGESVRITYEIGVRTEDDSFEIYRREWLGTHPDYKSIKEFFDAGELVDKACRMFDQAFNWQSPSTEEAQAAIESDLTWNQQVERHRIHEEAAGYDVVGDFPSSTEAKERFEAAQQAWKTRRKLAPKVIALCKKLHQQFETVDALESRACSVLSCEVQIGDERVLCAVRKLGSHSLTVDPKTFDSCRWQEILNSICQPEPQANPQGISLSTLKFPGNIEFSRPLTSETPDKAERVQLNHAIEWLEGRHSQFAELMAGLIVVGPLRALPSRRELLGFLSEVSTDPLLRPWQKLRDDDSVMNSVNRALKSLTKSHLSFLRASYGRIGRLIEIEDEMPEDSAMMRISGGRRLNPTDWNASGFMEGWKTSGAADFIIPKEGPFYSDLKDDSPEDAVKMVEEHLAKELPHEILYDLLLRDDRSGVDVKPQDVGVGISQIAPVLVQCFGNENGLIAIEQPEIHIHPALQAELGDVFIESALGENKNTFLLETHSEHLILRILRRIRETTEEETADWPEALREACPDGIRPEDVAVLYVQPGENGSEVIELTVDANGEFTCEWPGGFFEERLKEFF